MIKDPTVLVLGAGASAPYGYPTGQKLITNIVSNLSFFGSSEHQQLTQLGYKEHEVEDFRKALFMAGTNSIDAFLERRKDFLPLGRLTITQELAKYENLEQHFQVGDWYKLLFNHINDLDNFEENKLSIITFNYDRSFEAFLYTAFVNLYNYTDKVLLQKLKSINILHLHGQIGHLPWQDSKGSRIYSNAPLDLDSLKKSSEMIQIIYEVNTNKSDIFVNAKVLLNEANNIYFLRLGYHPINLQRLVIELLPLDVKRILGTSLNMTERERYNTQHIVTGNRIKLREVQGNLNNRVNEFLRENVSFE